ncbi:MAG: hypothetical protein ABF904_13600 [Ethanoligenens sp.]
MNKLSFHKILYGTLAAGMLSLLLTGCGPTAKTGSGSPTVTAEHVSVSSVAGKETSQKVTVTFTFDRAIAVDKDIKNELSVTLNGKALDTKTIQWTAAINSKDDRQLFFTLFAQPSDTDPTQGNYFGLYEGNLVITARNGSYLSAVTDTGKKYAAKWRTTHVQIPSGVTVEEVSSQTGGASAPARTTVHVASIGVVRAMTWVQFLENGQPVMQKDYKKGTFTYTNDGSFPIHDHQLFQMTAEDYAKEIAAGLESYFGKGTPTAGRFVFSSTRDTVTVTATASVNGETLSLQIFNQPEN